MAYKQRHFSHHFWSVLPIIIDQMYLFRLFFFVWRTNLIIRFGFRFILKYFIFWIRDVSAENLVGLGILAEISEPSSKKLTFRNQVFRSLVQRTGQKYRLVRSGNPYSESVKSEWISSDLISLFISSDFLFGIFIFLFWQFLTPTPLVTQIFTGVNETTQARLSCTQAEKEFQIDSG